MPRLFLALDPAEAFRREAAELIASLRGEGLPRVRWVTGAAMHVTLRFFGEVDDARAGALSDLVRRLGPCVPRAISVRAPKLVAFPNARQARVLALHVDDDGSIAHLAAAAERAATALGLPAEVRPFRPHLTLGRLREPADLRSLCATRGALVSGGSLESLTLYESDLGKEGAVHTPLVRHAL